MGFILSLFFCAPHVLAEYRVFLLKVTSPQASATPRAPASESAPTSPPVTAPPVFSERSFKSTLDPEQYVLYYPVPPGAMVTYTETWMCRGNTSGQSSLCDKP